MNILVISKEAWRDDQNGGNVLSNIFRGFDAVFAQIYCSEGEPCNALCRSYYQMTDRMMLDSLLHGGMPGERLEYGDDPIVAAPMRFDYKRIRSLNLESVRVARELLWHFAPWDEAAVRAYVRESAPEVIFAPCYGTRYMIRLMEIAADEARAPVISYISDDFYTNRQWRFSPIFWANHLLLRRRVREAFDRYCLVYTMTDEQKAQCQRDFGVKMKILRKVGDFEESRKKKSVNNPIRFVYAGGLYLNRYRTLALLVKAMKSLNRDSVCLKLDIYSSTPLKRRWQSILNDGKNSCVHGVVSAPELRRIYEDADVALHVEGLDRASASTVRMSFSTKIVDCLDSGCAVMAICDAKQAGLAYLKKNDAALCASSPKEIRAVLEQIAKHPELLVEYQRKAFALGKRKHDKAKVESQLLEDFVSAVQESQTFYKAETGKKGCNQ